MYRITKVLNHNSVLAVKEGNREEYLLMSKGIGFGKKVSERIEAEGSTRYILKEDSTDHASRTLVSEMDPECLTIADQILKLAEKEFGEINKDILFPLADHIAFAVKRIKANEIISNPLTSDIQVLFYKEYKVASLARELLKESAGIEIPDDEIGYIALHVHSAICNEAVSNAMKIAGFVHQSISMIEEDLGVEIDVQTLSYNRMMNHIKYMIARIMKGEVLKLNLNDYAKLQFPRSYELAAAVCNEIAKQMKVTLPEVETGYLAIHIERVYAEMMEK